MEKAIRNKCKFINDIDFFGKEPELYYKGKEKRVSWIGRMFNCVITNGLNKLTIYDSNNGNLLLEIKDKDEKDIEGNIKIGIYNTMITNDAEDISHQLINIEISE
mgnify:CR=1 FL=1